MNRSIGIVAVVVIAALVVGMVVVSGKLTSAKLEVARLRAALHTRQTPAGQVQAAAMMVGILRPVSNVTVRRPGEPVMIAPAAPTAAAPAPAPAAAPAAEATNAAPEGASNAVAQTAASNAPVATAPVAEKPIQDSDLAMAIEQMSEDWKARRVELENSAIATMGLNSEQAEAFRQTMFYMNSWMQRDVNEWTNALESGSAKVTEEPCVRILNKLSGSLLTTYTEMDRVLGKGWRSKAPKGFTLTDFIDPSIGVPMVAAQNLLRDKK